jgi:hypothetical protein
VPIIVEPTVNPSVSRSTVGLGDESVYTLKFQTVNQTPVGGKFLLELPTDQISIKTGSDPACFYVNSTFIM